jgi:hypothetical protein
MVKQILAFFAISFFVVAIGFGTGCGGGGGSSSGGTTATGSTDGNTTSNPTSSIQGQVVRAGSSIGIPGIRVVFYDASFNLVGEATTRSNGWFDANIPSSATRFHLDPNTISLSFYNRAYKYGTLWYSPLITTCTAPLPPITQGVLTTLPNNPIQVPLKSSVPPPPSGCS